MRPEEITLLKEQVRSRLRQLKAECPHSPLRLLCSMAVGADLLCAEIALEEGFSLVCALPLPVEEYRKDFEDEGLVLFDKTFARVEAAFTVPAVERVPPAPSRGFWYRQAGIFVAEHCHALLALWDGEPGWENGCGTAEAVSFMLHGRDGFRTGAGGPVLHLRAGRLSSGIRGDSVLQLLEGRPGMLEESLRLADAFNAESQNTGNSEPLVPRSFLERSGHQCRELHNLYLKAERLSGWYQKKYLNAIKQLALCGTGLVLCFLLYDEFAANLFLPLYGALLLLSSALLRLSRQRGYHARYLQYRVLAEALRIQFFLSAANIGHNIASFFTWTQRQDSDWVAGALSSLLALSTSSEVTREEMKRYWIFEQQSYHEKAQKRSAGILRLSQSTAAIMAALSVGLLITALFLEFLGSPVMTAVVPTDALRPILMMRGGEQVTVSAIIKILLGGASAVTLFLSSYYGKLSLGRKNTDHRKMAALYRQAGAYGNAENDGAEQLFLKLAQEEIIECGNWYSYCLDNPPSLNL